MCNKLFTVQLKATKRAIHANEKELLREGSKAGDGNEKGVKTSGEFQHLYVVTLRSFS